MERRVGPYVLRARLGAGGMGAVYRGEHVETGAVHAVKVLPPGDTDAHLRFRREAEAMARVDGHPHMLRIHAAGEEGGSTWIAMELAEGGSLADRLRLGPLPPFEAAAVVRALALGLAHVHACGVLHRDLKPDNVLFDATGTPKLADYGLARVAGAQALTQTGTLLGTPLYMAPEQARGETAALDARTDVYGLGAVLYHALTGHPPFAGRSPIQVIEKVVCEPPQPPRLHAPEVPDWLEAACLRALAKEPEQRFQSALELAEALEPQVDDEPAARSRAPAALAAVAVAALAIAGGALVLAASRGGAGVAAVTTTTRPPPATPPRVTEAAAGDPLAALHSALAAHDAPRVAAEVRRAFDRTRPRWEAVVVALGAVFEKDPQDVEATIAALGELDTPELLLLAAEVDLCMNRPDAAARRAAAAVEGATAQWMKVTGKWTLGRALLIAGQDVPRATAALADPALAHLPHAGRLRVLEAARATLVELAELDDRLHDFSLHDRRTQRPREVAELLGEIAALRVGELLTQVGPARRHLAPRYARALLKLERDVLSAVQNNSELNAPVFDLLCALAEADDPDARAARVLAVAVCWPFIGQGGAAPGPLLPHTEEALAGPLPERYRRLATVLRFWQLDVQRRDQLPELKEAFEALSPRRDANDPYAAQFRHLRITLGDRLTWRAFAMPEHRAELATLALDAMRETPEGRASEPDLYPRLRLRAQLLLGQPLDPTQVKQLSRQHQELVAALEALWAGRLKEAEKGLQGLCREGTPPMIVEATVALAIVQARQGDVASGRETVAGLGPPPHAPVWLPWHLPDRAETYLAAVQDGFQPSAQQPFPP